MKNVIKKYGYYLILLFIFVLGVFLRLKFLLTNPSFWDDECSLAWNVLYKSYSEFFSGLKYLQVAPPFFMVISKLLIKILGTSDFVLRLVPFFFGSLSMILFFVVSIEVFENKAAILVSNFIFAINQALVNYSSEFKQYSCDVFFTLLCLYLFLNLLYKKVSLKVYVIYILTFLVSIWFSFVSVFVICAGIFTLSIKQIKEKQFVLNKFLWTIVPFILNCLFYFYFYVLKNYTANITELNNYWGQSYIAKDFSNFLYLVKNILIYFFFPSIYALLMLIAIVVGAIILLRKKFYTAAILIMTILLECFISWLGYYPFEKRVILFLLPIILIFMSAPFEYFRSKNKFISILISVFFLVIYLPDLAYSYSYIKTPRPTRGYYSREMMDTMLSKIKPGEIIVVNQYSITDYSYYAFYRKIKNEVIYEGQNVNRRAFAESLKRGKKYWFYMPFGPSPTFDKWFNEKEQEVLFSQKGNAYPSELIYVYAK